MSGAKKGDPEEKIKELEEKIKRLEEKLEAEGAEGVAGTLLKEIGGKFGLGGLIKGLEKMPAFQERLRMIDEEVERRLREEPLKRVEEGRGRRPYTRTSFSVRTLADREPAVKKAEPRRRVKKEAIAPKELAIDVFEEEDHLRLIAELPGVEEKDIKIDVKGAKLTISTDVPHRRYHGEVTLPCSTKGEPKISYKKGVLEIRFEKGQ
ncbi:MAG: Hsp20/alpha crystallin family protein [Dehalococcoidia bacterium]